MAGRGSKPGERRGGRDKGTPNKRTVALQEAAQRAGVELPPGDPHTVVERLAKRTSRDVLEKLRDACAGMAAYYQPGPTTAPNKNENFGRFVDCSSLAGRFAEVLLQYEEPKLKAVLVAAATPMQPANPAAGDDNVVKLQSKDPLRAQRVYRLMIEGAGERKRA